MRSLPSRSDYHGREAEPPMIARVNIAAAGATDVNRVVWMAFDPLRREYELIFLTIDRKLSPQVIFPLYPSLFTFSIITGALMSKYSSILASKSPALSICSSHSDASLSKSSISVPT